MVSWSLVIWFKIDVVRIFLIPSAFSIKKSLYVANIWNKSLYAESQNELKMRRGKFELVWKWNPVNTYINFILFNKFN